MQKADASLKTEIITTSERLFSLRSAWGELQDSSGAPTVCLSWEWNYLWWTECNRSLNCELCIITVWGKGLLLALLPVYREIRPSGAKCLRFISSSVHPECDLYPEYMDILVRPDYREVATKIISDLLYSSSGLNGEILVLERVPADSSLLSANRRRMFLPQITSISSPVAELSGGFESYLKKLSSNSRSRFRRLLRQSESSNILMKMAENYTEAKEYLERLISDHQRVWSLRGERGAFFSDQRKQFHLKLLEKLHGRSAILARLQHNETVLASYYGFCSGKRFEFYQSAVHTGKYQECKSPGVLGHLLLMQKLAAAGITEYDFLAGESDYKLHMATSSHKLVTRTVYRPSLNAVREASNCLIKRFTTEIRERSTVMCTTDDLNHA